MYKKKLFFFLILLLLFAGFVAIQSGAVGLSGILRFFAGLIVIVVLVAVTCLASLVIWAFVAAIRKKTTRAVDGPQLVQQLPDGDWAPSALAFHERGSLVVSAILADDEAVLEAFPMAPDPINERQTRINRIDKDLGCHFTTDIEGDRDYCLRYSQVYQEVPKQEKVHYVALFKAWTTYHAEKGNMKAFDHEGGVMHCWKLGPDDVIGVRLETSGNRLLFSATRAWTGPISYQFP